MKILIADDSRAMRTIVIRTLRQAGFGDHSIVEASDGAEAIGQVKLEKPDLVLSDWNMSDMSGLELLAELVWRGFRVKFGFVAPEGSPEMRRLAFDEGASFFIAKPFTCEDFRQALESLLHPAPVASL